VLAARDEEGRATADPADGGRLQRTPHDLFSAYLDEREASDGRVLALFDRLVDDLAESADAAGTEVVS
jgi:hypothetical protein